MARIALNKSSLHRERDRLRTFERFLPSLDLKRKQLMAELSSARRALADLRGDRHRMLADAGARLPMAAGEDIALSGLVAVERVRVREENRLGVQMPALDCVDTRIADYGMLSRPHWIDGVVAAVRGLIELEAEIEVAERRVAGLEQAVRRLTQRVNLFEKVLIPQARKTIARIQVYLADAERAAVVRAKIAKRKHAAPPGVERSGGMGA
jgi:V/A-type H+-transporting ATPase subunit D